MTVWVAVQILALLWFAAVGFWLPTIIAVALRRRWWWLAVVLNLTVVLWPLALFVAYAGRPRRVVSFRRAVPDYSDLPPQHRWAPVQLPPQHTTLN